MLPCKFNHLLPAAENCIDTHVIVHDQCKADIFEQVAKMGKD